MISKLSRQISEYLNKQLIAPISQLSDDDKRFIHTQGLPEFIYTRITRSKFRRTGLDADTIADIKSKINNQILNNSAISFSIPFGAYKNWHLWSYPEPDWAEVFNIAYMIKFLAPISTAYEPGARIQYSYSDDVMDIVSNIPKNDYKKYIKVFDELLALFQNTAPDNLLLKMVRINDFYAEGEQLLEMQSNYEYNKINWIQKYPAEIRQNKLASAKHNLMINGVENLTNLNQEQLEERFLQSAMWCDALDCLKLRKKFNKGSTNIQIVFVKGPYLGLHIGSCETSVGQAWAKTGIMEKRGSRLLPGMVSHSQLSSLETTQEIHFIEVDTSFRGLSDNFSDIPVMIIK